MSQPPGLNDEHRLITMAELGSRERYQLLTSLVVPRPIGWISTRAANGHRNLAPFSYFAPVSPTPPLVSISIGSRRGSPKDTLSNIRETGSFCINVVTESQLVQMNASSGEHPPEVDEFDIAGLEAAEASTVTAPYVAGCPAVLECSFYREVEFAEAGVSLIVGEISAVRIDPNVRVSADTHLVDPLALRPVGRMGGELYGFLGEVRALSRPVITG
jgi:flavin reductase (DIM6/NTAB) family NADH-FMN oxidoreductase RutF